MYDAYSWAPYVSVAERLAKAKRAMQKRAKQGHPIEPVCIEGRTIARSPWGKAWCANLEAYSDIVNRLHRGRRYVRNGSVVDLQLQPRRIEAYVAGSETYRVTVSVSKLAKQRWRSICDDCAGGIDSLLELLRGRFDKAIMQRLCRQGDGLFPTPKQLQFSCSCPDGARMCKHVAAVLYGVGSRLDAKPELLFTLRAVDPDELIASAGSGLTMAAAPDDGGALASDELGDLFDIELEGTPSAETSAAARKKRKPGRPRKAGSKQAGKAKRAKKTTRQKVYVPPLPSGRDLYARLHRQLAKAGSLTSTEAQLALNKTAAELRPIFKRLVAENVATMSGRARGTRYHIRNDRADR